jgi:hypothetical protein
VQSGLETCGRFRTGRDPVYHTGVGKLLENIERLDLDGKRGEIGVAAFWEGLPDRDRRKETAVSILRAVRARN